MFSDIAMPNQAFEGFLLTFLLTGLLICQVGLPQLQAEFSPGLSSAQLSSAQLSSAQESKAKLSSGQLNLAK